MSESNHLFKDYFPSFFVAVSAGLMCFETNVITSTPFTFSVTAVVFFGAWLAYNASTMEFHLSVSRKFELTINAPTAKKILTVVCLAGIGLAIFRMSSAQMIWMVLAAVISFFYLFPVQHKSVKLGDWRDVFIAKNVFLSLVWVIATVTVPANVVFQGLTEPEILFAMARRFLFIYCLATLYDLPDTIADKSENVGSIAARVSIKAAYNVALITLSTFLILAWLDDNLTGANRISLIFSAAYTLAILGLVDPFRNRILYRVLVDSAMVIQAILVITI